MAAYLAAHPYASAVELAEVRAAERGKDPHQVPYFDLTVSAVKSVSVLHASYRVAARQARERGDEDQAAALDARADEIEAALMESAREAVAWLERHATYTRTGHHSARTGEWRDGDGLVASLFLHHLSRDGDPQLHVHVAIWNRVQRADGADEKWRTLDSRTLHNQRLAVAPVADRILETRLSALGYVMVPRADGNGAEVGGVSQDVMDLFSSRAVAVTGELDRLAREYEAVHGKPPSRRTLWLLHQQAGQNTRRTKAQARRTIAGQTGADRAHRGAAAGRLGSPDRAPRSAARCPRCTSRSRRFAAAARRARTGGAGRCGQAHRRADRRGRGADATTRSGRWPSSGSRCTGRSRCCRRAPTARRWSPRWPSWPSPAGPGAEVVQVTAPDITDVTSLGVRASDGGSIYRPPNEERYCTLAHLDTEEQILATAKRTVPQLVSAGAGPGSRRAHRPERRAARRRGDDAHRDHGGDGADRPGRGGQEPHDGRVRPAVDHVHRPAGHRPDHLDQRGPGAGSTRAWPRATTSPSSSARPKAPTSCAGPSLCTRTTCSCWTRPASSAPPTWP